MAHLLFILVCCIWGTSFLLMKFSLASFGYMHVSFFRALGGTVVLLALWIGTRHRSPLKRLPVGPMVFLAIVGYVLPYTIQAYVIGQVDHYVPRGSSFMALVIALVPLFTVAVQAMMLRIWPSVREWIGVLGGLSLLAMLGWAEVGAGVPVLVLVIAAATPLCYAIGNTYVRYRFRQESPLAVSASAMFVATLFMLTPAAMSSDTIDINEHFTVALVAMLGLGIICTGIGSWLFYRLIQLQGPLFAGMVGYIIPLIAIVLGAIAHEKITTIQIVTLIGVFIMVAIVQYRPRVATVEQLAEAEAREGS